jgi:hypothetical protein
VAYYDLNNWRGICLKELTAKVTSSMIASRLLTVVGTKNTKEQFATNGCQEAPHFLRSTIVLRRLHKKDTFVLSVDLIKAVDTVNHDLLFKVLLKFGMPEELVGVVR